MSFRKVSGTAAAAAAAAVLVLGGSAIAYAATGAPGSSAGSAASGYGSDTGGGPGRGGSSDTPVTGDEAAKVTAAVQAKDSSVTVGSVRKDADGSYDALGTKAGAPVMYDVSADLRTIAENAGRGAGPDGSGGAAPGGAGASGKASATSSSST